MQRRNWVLSLQQLFLDRLPTRPRFLDSIATRITHCVVIHFQNCHTNHFFKPFKSKFTNAITYSLLYISFPSLIGKKSSQSAAIDITQHARVDHKRQQRTVNVIALVFARAKGRKCVHCNWPVVPTLDRYIYEARATEIHTPWKVSDVAQQIR